MNARKLLWALRTFAGFAWENQVARFAPAAHDAMKRAGRAKYRGDVQTGAEGAAYLRAVADDYAAIAEVSGVAPSGALFRDREVLELGPGDTRGVALVARARGARSWRGVDPYDVQSRDDAYTRELYALLAEGEGRAASEVDALLAGTAIAREVPAGEPRADLVLSRSVLEHVHDLDALFADLAARVAPDAVLIHKVDLRCHGTRFDHELDFLRFPQPVYGLMASHLDLPNRVRANALLDLGARHGLATVWAAASHVIPDADVAAVRGRLPAPFAAMATSELAVLGVWLVQVGAAHPLAARARRYDAATLEPLPVDRLSRY